MNKTNEPTEKNMETKTPINQRIDKTKLEKHPSGDGWLVPMRNGEKAWVFTFGADEYFAYPIRGLGENWNPEGFAYDKENPNGCDLMLGAYIDPYAELKAAHAAGKVIQAQWSADRWLDLAGGPDWTLAESQYRIKPDWTLGRSVNGFTLGEGQEWHRNDFTEDMLPDGWRPLLLGEIYIKDDEWIAHHKPRRWNQSFGTSGNACWKEASFSRTRRPLPEVKKPVPLGPEDITPGSCVRYIGKPFWTAIESISSVGIVLRTGFYSYEKIKGELEISRDGGKTWEACSK